MNAKRHIHGGLSRMLATLLRSQSFVALALIAALSVYTSSALAFSFACPRNNQHQKIVLRKMATNDNHNEASTAPCFQMNHLAAHPSTLPGDPSLVLFTNMDLKEKKMEVMKAISKAIKTHTGKPEAYIAVTITDNASLVWAGSDAPAALGTLSSIGSISIESNGRITKDVTELLEPFGLSPDRIYINFFDMPRGNVGWNKATFAG